MGNIQVSANDNWFLFVKFKKVFSELLFPFHTVFKAFQTVLRVRGVNGDKVKFLHFESDYSALLVMLFLIDAVSNGDWLMLSKDSRTRIALFSA